MFENNGFRQMVAAHLPVQFRGVALDAKEEGWEAMAMRDELTDEMLHNAFGEAISQEVMQHAFMVFNYLLILFFCFFGETIFKGGNTLIWCLILALMLFFFFSD